MSEYICENPECGKPFSQKVHNAVYCSPECRRVVTNQKVLDKYYEKKERKASRGRICEVKGCNTILSIYNEDDYCGPCGVTALKARMVEWGYDKDELDEDWSY